MNAKTRIASSAAAITLIAATALSSAANAASIPSSPAERQATAQLNIDVLNRNAAATERSRVMEAQYRADLERTEALNEKYRADLIIFQDNRDR